MQIYITSLAGLPYCSMVHDRCHTFSNGGGGYDSITYLVAAKVAIFLPNPLSQSRQLNSYCHLMLTKKYTCMYKLSNT